MGNENVQPKLPWAYEICAASIWGAVVLVMTQRSAKHHHHPYVVHIMDRYSGHCVDGKYCATRKAADAEFVRRLMLLSAETGAA